ncbi:flavin reductase family protein [Kitasatospora sp. NPDC051853]|uniref:flavin reductase family protein n=1 Tax=Kitasatospora sp. NPDC051853 TaxID=3364058 RepID=UPI00379B913F
MSPDLRGVMRDFATGVCVATTYADRDGTRRHDAVTLNSLTSVSLDPPLVSLSLHRESRFLGDLLQTKKWAVAILDAEAEPLARSLARGRPERAAAVAALPARPGSETGALLLDAMAGLECVLRDSFEIGDHTMVIGEVVATAGGGHRPPLLFLHGGFRQLPPSAPSASSIPSAPSIPSVPSAPSAAKES